MEDENRGPDRVERARMVALYGFIVLVVVVVVLDRFAPAFLPNYEPLGDAALGLLLGAITALIVGEGVTRAVNK